jgi:hypothetical protein
MTKTFTVSKRNFGESVMPIQGKDTGYVRIRVLDTKRKAKDHLIKIKRI